MWMIIAAVVALSVICSTRASRAAGRAAMKPLARVALVATLAIWAAIILLPHGS